MIVCAVHWCPLTLLLVVEIRIRICHRIVCYRCLLLLGVASAGTAPGQWGGAGGGKSATHVGISGVPVLAPPPPHSKVIATCIYVVCIIRIARVVSYSALFLEPLFSYTGTVRLSKTDPKVSISL